MRVLSAFLAPACAAALLAATRSAATPTHAPSPAAVAAPRAIALTAQVVESFPHDPQAFTQGLLLHNGVLYESTGLYGRSSLRRVDLESGQVLEKVELSPSLFGEGLARVGERLIQLTWRERKALIYDLATLERRGELTYDGEGWGLCFDGTDLVMSDGSHRLYFRDPETFALRRQLAVTLDGSPLTRLNELECVGDTVYANVWTSDRIAAIRKRNGVVTALIDASGMLSPADRAALSPDAVLNGIAHDQRDGTFLLTGKLWPRIFRVRFVPP